MGNNQLNKLINFMMNWLNSTKVKGIGFDLMDKNVLV